MLDSLEHKWRMFRLVRRTNGLSRAVCEVLYHCCTPFIYGYTKVSWWWHRTRGLSSLLILGNRLSLYPTDKGVSIELAVYRVHEPCTSRLLARCLQPGMTVIDVGCNIGYYALLEAQRVGPTGRVIAIEPEPTNAQLFLHNVQANGYQNIVFHQVAISDRNGTSSLRISEKSNRHSLNDVPWPTTGVEVPIRTLDSLMEQDPPESVDLVRMDLEGHEVVVLSGMLRTIERYSPRLVIEIHPDILGAEAVERWLHALKALGYKPDWVFDQERDIPFRWRFLRPETPTMDELISDPRIQSEPKRPLMAFFSKNLAVRVCVAQKDSTLPQHLALTADNSSAICTE